MAFEILKDNWKTYLQEFTSNPVKTKSITSGVVYIIGDLISQAQKIRNIGEIDRLRVMRSGLAGLMHGPMCHFWYIYCDLLF